MAGNGATLSEQLRATRDAVAELAEAVDRLSSRERVRNIWQLLTGIVVIGLVALSVFVVINSFHVEDELRQLGRNLFLVSCESTNEGRRVLREDSIRDAEALIAVTNADVTSPERAEEYREATRRNVKQIEDRDCQAELREAGG